MIKPFALLDSADQNRARLYTDFQYTTALTAAELDQLDTCLERGWSQGLHACLILPYDFGRDLMGIADSGCTMEVAWYKQLTYLEDCANWLSKQLDDDQPAGIIAPELAISKTDFDQRIADIHEYIRAGETYQVNFTTHCDFTIYGHPLYLYAQLRRVQPAPYAALIYHGDDHWTLSLSPERFYSIDGRKIISEPMKGTAPILGDGHDEARAAALAVDVKNRAENAMIVDLLRNDLGKMAQLGSVTVHNPFAVKAHGKVWQMTTEVHAELRPDATYADLIRATFPCGSITGAPKYRTMQLIDQLETEPRGLYTGSIGYLERDGKGCFNITIRTMTLHGQHGRLGVGGGITIDSTADGEYEECHWKKAFLQHIDQPFQLFETLAVTKGNAPLLEAHLKRLECSAQDLGFTCDIAAIRSAVEHHLSEYQDHSRRMKISLWQNGKFELESHDCPPLPDGQTAIIHPETLPDHDPLRRYKISHRAAYDQAWQQAAMQGAFDALVFNQQGYLLEGGRSSVFICVDGQWYTPALELDILPGIMRQQVLNNPRRWLGCPQIQEHRISRDMLTQADTVLLGNALRGLFPVRLV
ncbi:aminodeoxychorismate synthase component I [Cardiobacteriaceae bacterium TAE3-ERU3]|nr:aminodeoxychorismate synthase component I [Cardiobacteriaceae bacterium TAE3-ERU3]